MKRDNFLTNEYEVRKQFPLLNDNDIVYFDYAATCPMHESAIKRWTLFQTGVGTSISRGNSILSRKAEEVLHRSEDEIRLFLNLDNQYEFIYSKNVTEAINILALSVENEIREMDIILVGPYEHHSNYLPWKNLAKKKGALFFELPINSSGLIDYDYITRYKEQIKIIAVSSTSNAYGGVVDIEKICELMSDTTMLFVDDSQLCAHGPISTNRAISAHFIPSHKIYGPKNIALTAIKAELIKKISPVLTGGGMVETVGFIDTWRDNRFKFFPGTIDIALIYAMAGACNFLREVSYKYIEEFEQKKHDEIVDILTNEGFKRVELQDKQASHVISFYHEDMHAHDINEFLSDSNVIIRSGNMCAQNAIKKIGLNAINRISLGLGITENDIKILRKALREVTNSINV